METLGLVLLLATVAVAYLVGENLIYRKPFPLAVQRMYIAASVVTAAVGLALLLLGG